MSSDELHGRAEGVRDRLFAESLADVRANGRRPRRPEPECLVEPPCTRVHAARADDAVVALRLPVVTQLGAAAASARVFHPSPDHVRARSRVSSRRWLSSLPRRARRRLSARRLDGPRRSAARRPESRSHAPDRRAQLVGVDAALDDRRRTVNPLEGEHLHEILRDDPAAHVAAVGSRAREVARLVDVDLQREVELVGEAKEEEGEQRARRTAPDDPHAGAVLQRLPVHRGARSSKSEAAIFRIRSTCKPHSVLSVDWCGRCATRRNPQAQSGESRNRRGHDRLVTLGFFGTLRRGCGVTHGFRLACVDGGIRRTQSARGFRSRRTPCTPS